ncbi:hypothetical protein JCM9140_3567 [Halalkalibacter wakoensis JCM 9140]|uniref:DUF72 domain-containing protein n=2 Tax=Halalkalibacter wakoensis TaxID=127891 RepID=W4Q658_9BACI|nr:hypothetical protein JCM9140_3567 [Halalkalibacter wakoensis JCM 9140]
MRWMIYIGLAGWGDHDDLYIGMNRQSKLEVYAGHFPIVEIDASFYAVQPLRNMIKWLKETPNTFRFVVKAFQGMTGHQRGIDPFSTKEEMFEAFRESVTPLLHANKLAMILCQFPPWFDCKKEHVQWVRYVKEQLTDLPVALEFRHRSWFDGNMKEKTLQFMRNEQWIHSICDEPQAGMRSIPIVLEATHPEKTLIRFHGRNIHGWNDPGDGTWRDVRYLYKYNEDELCQWKENIETLAKQTKDIFIIFNNNSGGDAATNAKQLIQMLGIEYQGLAPRQLDLF